MRVLHEDVRLDSGSIVNGQIYSEKWTHCELIVPVRFSVSTEYQLRLVMHVLSLRHINYRPRT